jgi:choloylglycine hydrolase
VFTATGQGAGVRGLPGDASPPSRFVKVAVMKEFVYPPHDASDALNIAQHIINNVDLPAGYTRTKLDSQIYTDRTLWVVFKDLTHKVFYYRTYEDTTLHSVVLSDLDFSENAPQLKMPLKDNQFIVNVTQKFLQSQIQP